MNEVTLNLDRLIECRKKLGITKQEAAKRMQMSQPAYLRYESGERTPSFHVIYYMAQVLGTSADYLMGITENPAPNGYWVDYSLSPELFELVEKYHNDYINGRKRLLAYYREILTK